MSFFVRETPDAPKDLRTWAFWRNMIVFLCVFSCIGHTFIEWPYCAFGATFFNSVSWTDDVLANPFKPFFVYGIAAVILCVFLEPLKRAMVKHIKNPRLALFAFYIVGVFLGMAGELIQGFLQNQPVDGVYPLWDVSNYPGNILGQAWIVNDILLGAVITVAMWHIFPFCHIHLAYLKDDQANIFCALVVLFTLVLTALTY